MNFSSFINKAFGEIKVSRNFSENIVKKEKQVIQKEKSIQIQTKQLDNSLEKHYSKKYDKKIKYRFLNSREAKLAKDINYDAKYQSPKQISDTLKLITIIQSMTFYGEKWTREYIYKFYAHIIDARIVIINGIKTLQHLYSFSEYANMNFINLKNKVDNLIKKIKKKEYVEIYGTNKLYKPYEKDFTIHLTNGKILKKCITENSFRSKKELTHTLFNDESLIFKNIIDFLEKIKRFCNGIFDRKEKYNYFKFFKNIHEQQKQITSDLIFTISDRGKFTINIGKRKTKTLNYVWIEEKINSNGQITNIIRGRDKEIKECFKDIFRTVKLMTVDKNEKDLEGLLKFIQYNANIIKNKLYSLSRDSFKPHSKKKIILEQKFIIINPELQKDEEIILKRIKEMQIPILLKNIIFDHNKKICTLVDSIKQNKFIMQSIKKAQCIFPDRFKIRLKKDSIYSFIV